MRRRITLQPTIMIGMRDDIKMDMQSANVVRL